MFFRRKKAVAESPVLKEFKGHQKSLRYFIKNQSGIGVYGDSDDLQDAKNAMRYFARMKFPEDETPTTCTRCNKPMVTP